MSVDNENADEGNKVLRYPRQSSGKYRNIIASSTLGAVGIAALGYFAFGFGINYEQRQTDLNSARRTEANIVAPLMVIESTPGAFKSGAAVDVITGITPDGSLLIQSGALVLGPDGSPKITLSGSTVAARGTLSGYTITRSGIGAGVGQAACYKTGGVLGYCSTTPTNGTCTCN